MSLDMLDSGDVAHCARMLPAPVKALMEKFGPSLMLGGGFLRATIAGETVSDIDIFSCSAAKAEEAMTALLAVLKRPNEDVYRTDNALSLSPGKGLRVPIQFITRWTFESAEKLVGSFDFTVACAAIYYLNSLNSWFGVCDPRFYRDLAAKRLVYRSPERNEEAGGSLLRAFKFARRGYKIDLGSIAGLVARLTSKIEGIESLSEARLKDVVRGLLMEVDPNAIDPGIDDAE